MTRQNFKLPRSDTVETLKSGKLRLERQLKVVVIMGVERSPFKT